MAVECFKRWSSWRRGGGISLLEVWPRMGESGAFVSSYWKHLLDVMERSDFSTRFIPYCPGSTPDSTAVELTWLYTTTNSKTRAHINVLFFRWFSQVCYQAMANYNRLEIFITGSPYPFKNKPHGVNKYDSREVRGLPPWDCISNRK